MGADVHIAKALPKWTRVLLLLGVLLCGCRQDEFVSGCGVAGSGRGDRSWSVFLGGASDSPAFPDPSAQYWGYGFDRQSLPYLGIRIAGTFPRARYFSVGVYDMATRNPVAVLPDVGVKTCGSAGNPYAAGAGFDGHPSYVVEVLPARSAAAATTENVLTYDPSVTSLAIVLRVYLAANGESGGVELPSIEAFDTRTGVTSTLPPALPLEANLSIPELQALVAPLFFLEDASRIHFYNVGSDGLYANPDNHYLAAPVTRQGDEIFVLGFKAPTTPATPQEYATADTRYWSLTQGDEQTFAYGGLTDEHALTGPDGYVTIVFADLDSEVVRRGQGLNLVQWRVPPGRRGLFIYRNLVTRPGFAGDIARVPQIDRTNFLGWAGLRANLFIGDYAPVGRRMTRQAFLDEFGASTWGASPGS